MKNIIAVFRNLGIFLLMFGVSASSFSADPAPATPSPLLDGKTTGGAMVMPRHQKKRIRMKKKALKKKKETQGKNSKASKKNNKNAAKRKEKKMAKRSRRENRPVSHKPKMQEKWQNIESAAETLPEPVVEQQD